MGSIALGEYLPLLTVSLLFSYYLGRGEPRLLRQNGAAVKRERMGRIDHELQRELAKLISTELKDPRLGFVTVTRVEITNDMHSAKVYVSIIGDRHVAKQSMAALESAKGFLRGELGHAVSLRHTPELAFVEDRTTEKAIALSQTLARTGQALGGVERADNDRE